MINLFLLAVAVGLGFIVGRLSRAPLIAKPASSEINTNCLEQLQQVQLREQSTLELSQFKAGFLARTSHELRSPLNGIIGVHQLILGDLCESPEEEREFIAQANESTLKLVKLLDEIIHVSKVQYSNGIMKIEPLSVESIFENVFSLTYLLAANRNLKFDVVYPDPDVWILADRRSLEQVLISLISGAIGTMQNGKLSLTVQPDGEVARIRLEDDRPIEAWCEAIDLLETQPSLPDANPEPSLGFSLLLSQTLIEAMNGRFTLNKLPLEAGETVTQIECAIPRITVE